MTRDSDIELVVSPEQAPKPSPASWFSIQNGSTLINAYPCDVQTLRDDPVVVQVRLKDTGVEKMRESLKTGRATQFTMDELVSAHATSGLPGLSKQVEPLSFHVGNRSGSFGNCGNDHVEWTSRPAFRRPVRHQPRPDEAGFLIERQHSAGKQRLRTLGAGKPTL